VRRALAYVRLVGVVLFLAGCGAAVQTEPWTEPFDNPDDWRLSSDAAAEVAIADGALLIHVQWPEQVAWAATERTFADFRLSVEAEQVTGPLDNEYGVLARMKDDAHFYAFSISGDGYVRVARYDEGVWTLLGPDWSESPAVQQGQAVNTLVVEVEGTTFKFLVNDEFIAQVEDDALAKGEIGLYAGAFGEPGVRIKFDNLRVEPLQ